MSKLERPSEDNGYLAAHIALLRNSFRHFTGRDLTEPRMSDADAARYLYRAPLVLMSHDAARDPIFNYANETAQSLFGMGWDEITELPSRYSAEKALREDRQKLLDEVAEKGYIDHYEGVRIGRRGRRFVIENATVWNLLDSESRPYGQAVTFKHWRFV
jgi:hypothetical protein